jgi:hypothetical protein
MSWDLVADFGADPTGTADCTTALNTAFSTIGADTFGGRLNVPKGAYKLQGQTSYSSSKPISIVGEGQQASQFHMASTSSSLGYMCIAQGATFGDRHGSEGTVELSGFSFYNDVTSSAFTNTNIALYLSGVNHGSARNIGIYQGAASQKVNQGIVHNGCSQFHIQDCDIWAVVNCVKYEGYCQVNTVEDSHLWSSSNSGAGNTAALLYYGQTLGCAARHVICHDGDRGVLATQDSGGQQPHLFEFLDVETNNHTISHFEFDYGLHVTMLGCILSGANVSNNPPGLFFGDNFQGEATIAATQFIGIPGHSAEVRGGGGYIFDHCKWGGSGSYKYSANAYDELFVIPGSNTVSVMGSRFNTDPILGVGTSMAPRYAINQNGGSVWQTDNEIASASLYGSGQQIH